MRMKNLAMCFRPVLAILILLLSAAPALADPVTAAVAGAVLAGGSYAATATVGLFAGTAAALSITASALLIGGVNAALSVWNGDPEDDP